jgi:tetratricopeptide (TPR) repeat protein
VRRALAALPSSGPRREDLELVLLAAADLLGEGDEVEQVARPLLARIADPDRYAEISWRLCSGLVYGGRAGDSITLAEEALARPGLSGVWTARLLAAQAIGHIFLGQSEQGDAVARQALAAAEQAGDQIAAGNAWENLAVAALHRRDQAAALDYVERAVQALRGEPRVDGMRLVMMANCASLLQAADRLDEAGAVIGEAMTLAEQIGTHRLGLIGGFAADHYLAVGEWDDALAVLESVSGLQRDDERFDQFTVVADGLAALIAAHRDDEASLRRHLELAEDLDAVSPVLRTMSYSAAAGAGAGGGAGG